MLDKFLYMAILDEIDPSLPKGELTIRRIAKYGSMVMAIIACVIIFPVMILGSIIDKWSNNFFSNIMLPLIIHGVLKPYRYLFYQLIYWPLKVPVMIFSKQS
ncbi:MAG TPA: hypothetical protein DDW51_27135 [Cyanobacteria bacterium UBA11367]|nr:hypothetical protein [Cyanobacteria bacterium UBA11367]